MALPHLHGEAQHQVCTCMRPLNLTDVPQVVVRGLDDCCWVPGQMALATAELRCAVRTGAELCLESKGNVAAVYMTSRVARLSRELSHA
jgi:hypothetical protein